MRAPRSSRERQPSSWKCHGNHHALVKSLLCLVSTPDNDYDAVDDEHDDVDDGDLKSDQ